MENLGLPLGKDNSGLASIVGRWIV